MGLTSTDTSRFSTGAGTAIPEVATARMLRRVILESCMIAVDKRVSWVRVLEGVLVVSEDRLKR
jgi:hypothetical protein